MIRPIFAALTCSISNTISANPDWQIKSIKENFWLESNFSYPTDTEIEFSNGHIAKTGVIEFELLDLITSDAGVVFVMSKGRACSERDMGTLLYVNAIHQATYDDYKRYGLP